MQIEQYKCAGALINSTGKQLFEICMFLKSICLATQSVILQNYLLLMSVATINRKRTKTAFSNSHNSYVIYECIFIYCPVSNLRNEFELGLPVLHNHRLQHYL